jgi:hypothetical protein
MLSIMSCQGVAGQPIMSLPGHFVGGYLEVVLSAMIMHYVSTPAQISH